MGTLLSPSKIIGALRWVKLDGKALKAKSIISRGGYVVVELDSGALWSPSINGRFAYTPGNFSDAVLRMLVEMGRVPRVDYLAHKAAIVARDKHDRFRDRQQAFQRAAEHLGIKLTRQQAKKAGVRP